MSNKITYKKLKSLANSFIKNGQSLTSAKKCCYLSKKYNEKIIMKGLACVDCGSTKKVELGVKSLKHKCFKPYCDKCKRKYKLMDSCEVVKILEPTYEWTFNKEGK